MKLGRTESVALQVIGAIGIIALVAIAPGMTHVLRKLGKRTEFNKSYVSNILSRLKKKGYVGYVPGHGTQHLQLTKLGKERLQEFRAANRIVLARPKPRKWDCKWRIVTFDIPERFRRSRDQIRHELQEAGFVQLHKSVWVTPYPCEEFIALLKADQHIGKGLLYIVAEKVEYSKKLQAIFKL